MKINEHLLFFLLKIIIMLANISGSTDVNQAFSQNLICTISSSPNELEAIISSPLTREENRGLERLNNLLNTTKLLSSWASLWTLSRAGGSGRGNGSYPAQDALLKEDRCHLGRLLFQFSVYIFVHIGLSCKIYFLLWVTVKIKIWRTF